MSIPKLEYDLKRTIVYLTGVGAEVTRLAGDGPLSQFHLLAVFPQSTLVKAIHVLPIDSPVDRGDLEKALCDAPLSWQSEIWEWNHYKHTPSITIVECES